MLDYVTALKVAGLKALEAHKKLVAEYTALVSGLSDKIDEKDALIAELEATDAARKVEIVALTAAFEEVFGFAGGSVGGNTEPNVAV